jgi:hypothetical protein
MIKNMLGLGISADAFRGYIEGIKIRKNYGDYRQIWSLSVYECWPAQISSKRNMFFIKEEMLVTAQVFDKNCKPISYQLHKNAQAVARL